MDVTTALISFSIAAGLLTLTPGLDTALVLRTATVDGARQAMLAALGILSGCLVWGFAAAVGLGALLAVSKTAYTVLKIAGAIYLLWLGFGMIRTALRKAKATDAAAAPTPRGGWYLRGLFSNLLNPKIGVFYVSFLPQFIPAGVNAMAFSMLLAGIHAAMGALWFAVIVLATRRMARLLSRPAIKRAMDGITGLVMIGFGVRLLLERRAA
jgi:threonine/homoserine/homoserine lactone efflux protein